MIPTSISSLLIPYIEHSLSETLLSQISTYLDLLLRWNARTNLTAIRSPEEIITRHFGEALFAARQIFPAENSAGKSEGSPTTSLADVGSGAGFPGLPIKLWSSQSAAPQLHVTLIESHQKKATFLREVIRALQLTGIEVQATRAELLTKTFDTVTLRAVEHFDQVLPTAAKLLNPSGRLAILIGEDQIPSAKAILPAVKWEEPHPIPNSERRVVFVGTSGGESS